MFFHIQEDRNNRNATWKASRLFLLQKSIGLSISATDLVVSMVGIFFGFSANGWVVGSRMARDFLARGYSLGKPPTNKKGISFVKTLNDQFPDNIDCTYVFFGSCVKYLELFTPIWGRQPISADWNVSNTIIVWNRQWSYQYIYIYTLR